MELEAELTLDEMLADPIVCLVIRRDGADEAQIPRSSGAWPGSCGRPSRAASPPGRKP
jgi:hypothetical protein